MFKCIDCEKNYDKKPDYCECGNNVFAEFGEKKREAAPFVMPFSYFSLAIFLSCIILSILTVFFLGNGWINNTVETNQKNVKVVQSNVPDIEKVWKSNPNRKVPTTDIEVKQEEKTPETVVNVPIAPKTQVQKQIKQTPVKIVKSTVSKPATKTTKNTTQVAKAKPQATSSQQSKNVASKTESQVQKPQTSQTNEAIAELNKYKTALRKALFFNLEVLTIQGQGDCIIEFNIDDSGKLINRGFYKTSDNVSVNNAVYKMMMKLPQYYPPPPSYKGAKLRLKFSFDNGSYEINYI